MYRGPEVRKAMWTMVDISWVSGFAPVLKGDMYVSGLALHMPRVHLNFGRTTTNREINRWIKALQPQIIAALNKEPCSDIWVYEPESP